jgi:hypothetical protein
MMNANFTRSLALKLVCILSVPSELYKVALFGVISILPPLLPPMRIITSEESSTFSDSNSISIVRPFEGLFANGK